MRYNNTPSICTMNLDIVGGTYYELCRDPNWHELYGSGLRAVHSLSLRSAKVVFHTVIGRSEYDDLLCITNALNVELQAVKSNHTSVFEYDYPLANPFFVLPNVECLTQPIKADCVIQFGMLEGNLNINAKTVIYDPQSPCAPKSFWANGSKAESLIWVANFREAQTFTGYSKIEDIKKYLFEKEKVEAAIIKNGTDGAIILQRDIEDYYVPAFKTKKVWPIGTGDIFTATFGYNYLIEKESLEKSAVKASLSTAYYAETVSLPIPSLINEAKFEKFYKAPSDPKRVYLAGPFFTMAQRWLIEQLRTQLLSFGFNVCSPYHDIGLGPPDKVVKKDIEAINNCDIMVAIVDGLDSGTLFEIGYAKAIDLPVVVFVEEEDDKALTMLIGSNCIIESDFSTVIYKTVWESHKS